MDTKPARTRIAPSPTGEYHIGHIRTCLYDYALAKQTGGQFIVRIEDTDRERYQPETIDKILDVLMDYGLQWDEGPRVGGPYAPYIQSERLKSGAYLDAAMKLVNEDKAYYCFCTREREAEVKEMMKKAGKPPMYDKHCRYLSKEDVEQKLSANTSYIIRLKIPEHEKVEYEDVVVGKVSWKSDILNDEVLIKSNGFPSYHLAVVVDDHTMGITHILRGVEWISSTPKHVLLYKYLGYEMPKVGHLSVILDFDGKGKLSKRKSGEKAFARYYLDRGYAKEALLNYLMLLGWSPKEQKDLLTLDEFVKEFSLERLQPQNPRISMDKLEWFSGVYMRKLSVDELYESFTKWVGSIKNDEIKIKAEALKGYFEKDVEKAKEILKLSHERLKKYIELFDQATFFYEKPAYTEDLIEKTKHSKEECLNSLSKISAALGDVVVNGKWVQETWEGAMRKLSDELGWKAGDLFMLLRLSIVGSPFSPPLIDAMNIIGDVECLARIEEYKNFLNKN